MWNELKITVRSTDLDEFSHVNNAKFVEYLEWGRFEWYDRGAAHIAFKEDGARALGTVVARMEVDFLREACRGDELVVHTALAEIGRKSLRFSQLIEKEGETIATARIVVVLFDLGARQSVTIPDAVREELTPLLVADDAT